VNHWDAERVAIHNKTQIGYYDRPERKPRMLPGGSAYVARQADRLVRFAGLEPGMRVLEVGCGMGRFTFLLHERGIAVEGLDLSPDLLDRLQAFDAGRIGVSVHQADIAQPPPDLEGRFDAVIGFMMLHHLHDLTACLAGVTRLLVPGGRVAFLEPNPYNPLYYVQVILTPGMSWAAERGLVRMRPRLLRSAMASAGLVNFRFERFGFFPSFVTNRRPGEALESAFERVSLWRPMLPFQLFGGAVPASA
jgi:SAM-dependent methyltransferase